MKRRALKASNGAVEDETLSSSANDTSDQMNSITSHSHSATVYDDGTNTFFW